MDCIYSCRLRGCPGSIPVPSQAQGHFTWSLNEIAPLSRTAVMLMHYRPVCYPIYCVTQFMFYHRESVHSSIDNNKFLSTSMRSLFPKHSRKIETPHLRVNFHLTRFSSLSSLLPYFQRSHERLRVSRFKPSVSFAPSLIS